MATKNLKKVLNKKALTTQDMYDNPVNGPKAVDYHKKKAARKMFNIRFKLEYRKARDAGNDKIEAKKIAKAKVKSDLTAKQSFKEQEEVLAEG